MKTIELIEYGDPVTTTETVEITNEDGTTETVQQEKTERPVTVLRSEEVDETPQPTRYNADGEPVEWRDPWQNALRRYKGQATSMNQEAREKDRYGAREKPEPVA